MILVDIYVPFMNQLYDFKLDETICIAEIVEELGEMLLSGEAGQEGAQNLLLCDRERQQVLKPDETLKQSGIGNGSRLMLI